MHAIPYRAAASIAGAAALLLTTVGFAPTASADTSTGTLVVCAKDSQGNALATNAYSAIVKRDLYTYHVDGINDNGCLQRSVPGGSQVEVWAKKEGTTSHRQSGTVPAGQELRFDFYTSKVTVRYPGALAFGGPAGDSGHFKTTTADGSRELFSDGTTPVMFRAATGAGELRSIPVTWPAAQRTGQAAQRTISVARVVTGNGEGVPGATVRYNDDGGAFWFHARGGAGTDQNGMLGFAVNGLKDRLHHKVTKSYTVAQQDYNASSERTNVFATTSVQFNYNHQMKYNQAESGQTAQYWFAKPAMELFPGAYTFSFEVPRELSASNTVYAPLQLTVDATPVAKTVAAARLTDSKGAPLAGATLDVYKGGWKHGVATTDAQGTALWSYDGTPAKATFALKHEGTRQQLAQQNLSTDSVAHFRTVPVTLTLQDHKGDVFTAGKTATATYYASNAWRDFGTTEAATVTKELLPVAGTTFAMVYEGSRQTSVVDLGKQTSIPFQTGLIQPAEGKTLSTFYSNSWRDAYEGLELLPGKATFKVDNVNHTTTVVGGTVNTVG